MSRNRAIQDYKRSLFQDIRNSKIQGILKKSKKNLESLNWILFLINLELKWSLT